MYGSTAALTKTTFHLLNHGVFRFLVHWQPWALLAAGVAGMVIAQSAFQAGSLDASLPTMSVIDPIVSIVIGVVGFGEEIAASPGALAAEVVALISMSVGVFLLARSESVRTASEDPGAATSMDDALCEHPPRRSRKRRHRCCSRPSPSLSSLPSSCRSVGCFMPHRTRWRLFLVAASWFFYGCAGWGFVPLLAVSTVLNHFMAFQIDRSEGSARRWWARVAVAANLAGLGWFKYIGFLSTSTTSILDYLGFNVHLPVPTVLLPAGISFFTFQAISYVVDVNRRKLHPVGLLDFAVYLSFFPHLLAGPIVRAAEFLPQIRHRIDPRRLDAGRGLWLVARGLFKKVVIASYLASKAADPLFNVPKDHAGVEALFGVYAYALQIYADFSGYTDIAIGLALLLGVRFPQNFDSPYRSLSLREFWRRWHMTLSRFLRDYLYIPLGGNRRECPGPLSTSWPPCCSGASGTGRRGPSWPGADSAEPDWPSGGTGSGGAPSACSGRRWRRDRRGRSPSSPSINRPIPVAPARSPSRRAGPVATTVAASNHAGVHDRARRAAAWIVTFHAVCFGWIFFRATSFANAGTVLGRIFSGGRHVHLDVMVVLVVVTALAVQWFPAHWSERLQHAFSTWGIAAQALALAGVVVVIDAFGPAGVAPFIYFRF